MTLDEYQAAARATAVYGQPVLYPALGLAGEAGEVCEKVKKFLRDDGGVMTDGRRRMIVLECGDLCWYVANLAADLGVTLEEVAAANVAKLADRRARGVIKGDGDAR